MARALENWICWDQRVWFFFVLWGCCQVEHQSGEWSININHQNTERLSSKHTLDGRSRRRGHASQSICRGNRSDVGWCVCSWRVYQNNNQVEGNTIRCRCVCLCMCSSALFAYSDRSNTRNNHIDIDRPLVDERTGGLDWFICSHSLRWLIRIRASHYKTSRRKCTFITVEQVKQTYSAKPRL